MAFQALDHGPEVPGGQGLLSKWPPLFEGKATIGMFYGDTVTAFFDLYTMIRPVLYIYYPFNVTAQT